MSESRKKWFKDNIGKTVYRTNTHKELSSKEYVTFEIKNIKQALALYNIEINSSVIKYFDNIEELKQYETLKQI